MFDLAGEVALVTGGAKGIGKGIAKALKQARAKVIIGDIDKNRGKEVANEMGVEFRHFDVTNKDLVDYTIQNIYEEYGKISILCSNAGIFPRTSIEKMTEKDWDEVQNINMKGTFFVTKAASYMKQIKEIIPVYTLGKPEDIGYTAVFLASREAGFITGQTIVVDGGQVLLETLTFI